MTIYRISSTPAYLPAPAVGAPGVGIRIYLSDRPASEEVGGPVPDLGRYTDGIASEVPARKLVWGYLKATGGATTWEASIALGISQQTIQRALCDGRGKLFRMSGKKKANNYPRSGTPRIARAAIWEALEGESHGS